LVYELAKRQLDAQFELLDNRGIQPSSTRRRDDLNCAVAIPSFPVRSRSGWLGHSSFYREIDYESA
jgi:hypothetical protein